MLYRNTLDHLINWKQNSNRKPLIIRGARQVGKTTLVRLFSKEFTNYIELNLEKTNEKNLFHSDDVEEILKGAYLLKNISPKEGTTLLFIDEMQESPEAIKILRYFYEEQPHIYVIAAGSLLEFALDKVPNFPVGRVDYLYMYPLNFDEYLRATHENAREVLHTIPIPEYAHSILLKLYHEYTLIGGMPEIITQYLTNKDIVGLNTIYHKLWQSYKDDAEKYAKNKTEKSIIKHVIDTAPHETDRIKFEKFGNSNYRSREVGSALRALHQSKVIQLVYPSTSLEPPIITDYKKRPRLQFLDSGLLVQVLLLQSQLIGVNDLNTFYRGKIIQHLLCQELISIHSSIAYEPNFWVRENKDSNAEVDLLYQYNKYVIPIEIKSGKQGSLKSLHQFIERSPHAYAIRFYTGNYKVEKHETPSKKTPYFLMNLPYYLGTQLPNYISHFVSNYVL